MERVREGLINREKEVVIIWFEFKNRWISFSPFVHFAMSIMSIGRLHPEETFMLCKLEGTGKKLCLHSPPGNCKGSPVIAADHNNPSHM